MHDRRQLCTVAGTPHGLLTTLGGQACATMPTTAGFVELRLNIIT
eukprot:gene12075-10418_t